MRIPRKYIARFATGQVFGGLYQIETFGFRCSERWYPRLLLESWVSQLEY